MLEKIIYGMYFYFVETYGFFWDKINSIDTEKNHSLAQLNLSNNYSFNYRPVQLSHFYKIMKMLDPCENDVFLDMGAGKGRAMILAGAFPFKRIIGVEISKNMAEVCQKNLNIVKHKKECPVFDVINTDAATYGIPKDVTIVFIHNAFPLIVLNEVITNIKKSVRDNPRAITLIYCNPMFSKEIEKQHGLEANHESSYYLFGLLVGNWIVYKWS